MHDTYLESWLPIPDPDYYQRRLEQTCIHVKYLIHIYHFLKQIVITINDINDSPPRFEKPYNGPYVISEGVPNSYIGTFVAIDLDGDGTAIRYNVTGDYSGR